MKNIFVVAVLVAAGLLSTPAVAFHPPVVFTSDGGAMAVYRDQSPRRSPFPNYCKVGTTAYPIFAVSASDLKSLKINMAMVESCVETAGNSTVWSARYFVSTDAPAIVDSGAGFRLTWSVSEFINKVWVPIGTYTLVVAKSSLSTVKSRQYSGECEYRGGCHHKRSSVSSSLKKPFGLRSGAPAPLFLCKTPSRLVASLAPVFQGITLDFASVQIHIAVFRFLKEVRLSRISGNMGVPCGGSFHFSSDCKRRSTRRGSNIPSLWFLSFGGACAAPFFFTRYAKNVRDALLGGFLFGVIFFSIVLFSL